MSRRAKTIDLIERAAEILADEHPMTVRQVYYQLVSKQVIKNCRGAYQAVSSALVNARSAAGLPRSSRVPLCHFGNALHYGRFWRAGTMHELPARTRHGI